MGFELYQQKSKLENIFKFMERMKSILEKAKSAIQKACNNIAKYYNCYCTSTPVFKSGDKMFLDFLDIYTICLSTILSYLYSRKTNRTHVVLLKASL